MTPLEADKSKNVEGEALDAATQQTAAGAGKDTDELSTSLLEVDLSQIIEHDLSTFLPSVVEHLATTHKAEQAGKPPANPTNLPPPNMDEHNSIHSVSPPYSLREHSASLLSDFVPPAIHESQWALPAAGNAALVIPGGNQGVPAALSKPTARLPNAASMTARQTMSASSAGDRGTLSALAMGERAAWLVVQEALPYLRGSVFLLAWPAVAEPRVTLGSDPGCDIVVTSPGVSREHAEIGLVQEHGRFFIADRKSTNKTFLQNLGAPGLTQVDGQAELTDGCVIQLGSEQVRLIFRCYPGAQGT
jgi:hypothetical protein